MYPLRDDKPILKDNLVQIVRACEAAGITRVEIGYSGSGDSGSINQSCFFPPQEPAALSQIIVAQKVKEYQLDPEAKTQNINIINRELNLEEAVDCYFYDTCHCYDIDFNGDGCEGTYVINLIESKLEVENEVFYTKSECHSFKEDIDLV